MKGGLIPSSLNNGALKVLVVCKPKMCLNTLRMGVYYSWRKGLAPCVKTYLHSLAPQISMPNNTAGYTKVLYA